MNQHELEQLRENLLQRDREMVEQMQSCNFGGSLTLEQRLVLADARAQDALGAVMYLCSYIAKSGELR